MNIFSNRTAALLISIGDEFDKAVALSIVSGNTHAAAYRSACDAFDRSPAKNASLAGGCIARKPIVVDFIYSARGDFSEQPEVQALKDYQARRSILDKALDVANEAMDCDAGALNGAELAIKVVKQIHMMTVTTAADEFSGMTIDDLERELGK